MADASRPQFTITLGNSGQVVKRAGPGGEMVPFSDSRHSAGSKRSVRDRLGSNVDSTSHFSNKRQRGDDSGMSLSASNYAKDPYLTEGDLRFKIMRKSMLKRSKSNSQQNCLDLRDILSRPAQSSISNLGAQRVPRQEDGRKHFLEPIDSRQRKQDPWSSERFVSEPKNIRQQLPESRDYRMWVPEPRDSRHVMPELKAVRHARPDSSSSSLPGLSSRSSDALPQMESLRSSRTPWTLDSLRQRPSDRFTGTSRAVSPPRRSEVLEQRPPVRTYDDSGMVSYTSKEGFEHSRPMNSAAHLAKSAQTAGPAKIMVTPPAPLNPSVPLVQKSSYAVDDMATVDTFLQSLGLEKYSIHFKAEEVDMRALKQMGDSDLKELGVPMGPRKKIMLALLSRAKRQI